MPVAGILQDGWIMASSGQLSQNRILCSRSPARLLPHMAFDTACPNCGSVYHADDAHAGMRVRCTRCGVLITLLSTELPAVTEEVRKRSVGWNWFWFLPLCAAVLLRPEGHALAHAWRLGRVAHQRWSWAVLISPSAYFCLSVVMASVWWPIYGLWLSHFSSRSTI